VTGPRALAAALLALAGLLAACGDEAPSPTAWSGGVPSAAALEALKSIEGRGFFDTDGVLGGGRWTVGPWAVVENPLTVKGPVVVVRQGERTAYVPVETDGDAAHLYQVATWTNHPTLRGDLSPAYRRVWEPRR
jgi:hypothetical protein